MRVGGKSHPTNSIHALQLVLSASLCFIEYARIVDTSLRIVGVNEVLKSPEIERIIFLYDNVVYCYRVGIKIGANCCYYLKDTLSWCVIASYKV